MGTAALGESAQGLVDLSGNLLEWVLDERASYNIALVGGSARCSLVDCVGGANRMYRGGYWSGFVSSLVAANRTGGSPSTQSDTLPASSRTSAPPPLAGVAHGLSHPLGSLLGICRRRSAPSRDRDSSGRKGAFEEQRAVLATVFPSVTLFITIGDLITTEARLASLQGAVSGADLAGLSAISASLGDGVPVVTLL